MINTWIHIKCWLNVQKFLIVVFLILLLVFPLITLADSVNDIIPDTKQWGLSRTKFKEQNGRIFIDVEIEGNKSLKHSNIDVIGYSMDVYYCFTTDMGSYKGLSSIAYILNATNKVDDNELKSCYDALVYDLSKIEQPYTKDSYSATWSNNEYHIEITIGIFKEYNDSNNKTVAIIISDARKNYENARYSNGTINSNIFQVIANATCDNYNHVGNQWSQQFFVNGIEVVEGTTFMLSSGQTIVVKVRITENDKYPDEAVKEIRHTVSETDLKNGFIKTLKLAVTENKGRYKGNEAIWKATFVFTK